MAQQGQVFPMIRERLSGLGEGGRALLLDAPDEVELAGATRGDTHSRAVC